MASPPIGTMQRGLAGRRVHSLSRRRRYRRRSGRRSGLRMSLSLAPMIDVTFLLLIFFVLTTTFKQAEGILGAQLPRDAGRPLVALPISPVVVRLTRTGPGDYAIAIDNFRDVPATPAELAKFLIDIRANPGFDDQTPVVIVADDDVPWEQVVDCWNAAVRAGCANITFGGR